MWSVQDVPSATTRNGLASRLWRPPYLQNNQAKDDYKKSDALLGQPLSQSRLVIMPMIRLVVGSPCFSLPR